MHDSCSQWNLNSITQYPQAIQTNDNQEFYFPWDLSQNIVWFFITNFDNLTLVFTENYYCTTKRSDFIIAFLLQLSKGQ